MWFLKEHLNLSATLKINTNDQLTNINNNNCYYNKVHNKLLFCETLSYHSAFWVIMFPQWHLSNISKVCSKFVAIDNRQRLIKMNWFKSSWIRQVIVFVHLKHLGNGMQMLTFTFGIIISCTCHSTEWLSKQWAGLYQTKWQSSNLCHVFVGST